MPCNKQVFQKIVKIGNVGIRGFNPQKQKNIEQQNVTPVSNTLGILVFDALLSVT